VFAGDFGARQASTAFAPAEKALQQGVFVYLASHVASSVLAATGNEEMHPMLLLLRGGSAAVQAHAGQGCHPDVPLDRFMGGGGKGGVHRGGGGNWGVPGGGGEGGKGGVHAICSCSGVSVLLSIHQS
jgi:hypothetical protein